MSSRKADLLTLGSRDTVHRQFLSVAIILCNKMDFSFGANVAGFCRDGHIFILFVLFAYVHVYVQGAMVFAGNKALVGSAIYANGLDLCSWVSYSPPYFGNTNQVLRWPIITYRCVIFYFVMSKFLQKYFSDDNINTGHSVTDSGNRSLAVQTPPVDFIVQNKTVSAISMYTVRTLTSYLHT